MTSSSQLSDHERLHRNHIDRFFVQQCLVRRFKYEFNADYLELMAIRDMLEPIIKAALNELEPLIFAAPPKLAVALQRCMMLCETNSGRQAIIDENIPYIKNSLDRNNEYLFSDENLVSDIAKKISTKIDFMSELKNKYNYFDYFCFSTMTAYCRGEDIYCLYQSNQNDLKKIIKSLSEKLKSLKSLPDWKQFCNIILEIQNCNPVMLDKLWRSLKEIKFNMDPKDIGITGQAFWLSSLIEPSNLNMAIAKIASYYEPSFWSPNIKIVKSHDNNSHDYLCLCIDLDGAPYDIDQALAYFRGAVFENLMNKYRYRACIPNIELYEKSVFAKPKPNLEYAIIRQWDQVKKVATSLWAWDLINSGACNQVEAYEKIYETLGFSEDIPGEKPFLDGFRDIRNIIETRPNVSKEITGEIDENDSRKRTRDIDEFVTGFKNVKLGLRSIANI